MTNPIEPVTATNHVQIETAWGLAWMIGVWKNEDGDIFIQQDGDVVTAHQDQLPALISALQAALPDSTPPTVSKGDGA